MEECPDDASEAVAIQGCCWGRWIGLGGRSGYPGCAGFARMCGSNFALHVGWSGKRSSPPARC